MNYSIEFAKKTFNSILFNEDHFNHFSLKNDRTRQMFSKLINSIDSEKKEISYDSILRLIKFLNRFYNHKNIIIYGNDMLVFIEDNLIEWHLSSNEPKSEYMIELVSHNAKIGQSAEYHYDCIVRILCNFLYKLDNQVF